MADELSIILKSKIGDSNKDISDLNSQINKIQEKLNKVDLSIGLDSKVMSSLDDFVKSIKQARDLSKEMTQAIKEEVNEVRNLDGSIQRVTTQWLKNGEVIQKTKNIIKQQTDETNKATESARQLASEWDTVGQKIKEVTKQNGQGNQVGGADTYKNGNTTQTVNYDANGQVTSAKVVEDLGKEQQATEKYNNAVTQLKNNVTQLETRLSSLGDSGQHISTTFNALTQAMAREESSSTNEIQNITNLTEQYSQLEEEIRRVESLGTRRTSVDSSVFSSSGQTQTQQLRDYITQAYAAEGATSRLEQTQISLSSAFDRNGNEIHSYTVAINDNDGTIRRYSGDIDRLSSSLYQNSTRTTQAMHSQQGFAEQFGIALSRVPIWLGATTAIFGTLHTLQNIVSTIVEVDTQMTNLKRVMNTGTDFNAMLQSSIDMANELGQKLTDVLSVETQFGSAGFSSVDTLALTKVTALLQNISDLQPDEAMTAITAAMKSFNISAKDSITIANKLNNVDNNYTITTKDLADGLTKSAAAAKTYGVSLNDLLGMQAAVNGVTKESGTIIGNSLKTIFSRLESSSGSIKALQSVGIEVKDTAGNMKSATTVLGDLAGKWNTLTNTQQQSLAVTIAGRYQLTRFLALMQNWGTVVNASNTALNSQNSAINENAKYQESLQAKINRLNTAWKELSLAIGNASITDGFIDLVNGLKDLANVATPVVKAIGVLPIVLGTAGFATVAFSSKIRGMIMNLTLTQKAMQMLSIESTALKASLVSTGIGALFVIAGFALEKIIGYYGQINAEREKEKQQLDQSLRGYQENTKQVSAWVDEYTKLDKLKNSGGLDNTQQQQYLDIQQKIANVLPTVVAGTDAQGRSILESSDAIKANIALLKEKIKLEHESAVTNAPQDVQESNNNIDSFRQQIKQKEDDLKQLNEQIKASNELANDPSASQFMRTNNQRIAVMYTKEMNQEESDVLDLKKKINDEYSKQAKTVQTILSVDKSLTSNDVNWLAKLVTDGKVSVDQIDLLGKVIQTVRVNIGKSLPNNFFSNMTAEQIKSISNLSDEYKHGQISFAQYTNSLQHSGISIDKVSTLIDGMTTSQDKSAKATLSQADAQQTLQDILDGTTKAEDVLIKATLGYTQSDIDEKTKLINIYNTLSQVKNRDANENALLRATMERLREIFPGLVNDHNVNIKAMMNEVDAQSILVQAITKSANGQLTAEQAKTLNTVLNTNKRIDSMKNEVSALSALQKAYQKSAQTVENMLTSADAGMALASGDVAKWTTIAMQQKKLFDSVGGGDLSSFEKQLSALESSNNSNLNKLGKTIGYTPPYSSAGSSGAGSSKKGSKGSGSGSGSSSSAANDAKQKAQDLANSIVQIYKDMYQKEEDMALAANQKQLDALDAQHQKVLDNLTAEEKAYEDSVNKKLALIDKQSAAQSYNEGLQQKQQAIQDLQNQINVMSLDNSPEGQAKLADLKKQLAQDQQDLTDTQSQHTTDLRKQNLQDGLDSYKADIQQKQDAETAKYNAAKDELNKERDAIQKHYDNLINDQRKFTKIQNEIMSGHYDQAKKDLAGFTKYLKDHMSDIGQSITENLLDNISAASKSMSSLSGKGSGSSSGKSSSSSSSSSSKNRYYTVKSGDTLGEIADKYYGHNTKTYIDKISKANHISDSSKLKVGERLLIPFKDGGYTGNYEGVAYLHQKEQVFKAEDTTNLLNASKAVRGLAPLLQNFVQKVGLPDIKTLGNKVNNISMNVNIASLTGDKQGAMNFFGIIQNEMNKLGVNN